MTEEQVKTIVKKRINDLMNAKDISMRNLSIQLGFSDGYINQIMNNDMMPSLHNIIILCEAMHMTLSDFFSDDEVYSIEYYKLSEELKKMSDRRLEAIYTALCDINEEEPS